MFNFRFQDKKTELNVFYPYHFLMIYDMDVSH